MVCKGRNGYFHYAGNDVTSLGVEVLIQIKSKRISWRNLAPIIFQGTRQEVQDLLTDLLEKVRTA